MAGLFDGKRGLITGVFNKQSIAWSIADRVMAEGGDCGFTYMPDKPDDERKKNLGRVQKLTDGNPRCKFLEPMDVTNDEHIQAVVASVRRSSAHRKTGAGSISCSTRSRSPRRRTSRRTPSTPAAKASSTRWRSASTA